MNLGKRVLEFFAAVAGLFAKNQAAEAIKQQSNNSRHSPFQFHGKSNGASRRRKSNRLHLSRKTRNKHR